MVRIPSEYQEVEYLESTDGTGQYIDTGIVLTDLTSVKVRFNLPSKKSYGSAFGSRYNSFCISRMQNHEYFVAEIYGRPTSLSNFRYTQNEWVDAELHMTQCVLNGTVYEIQRGTTVTSYPIWMFGKSKSYAAALDVKNACKISYLQIYEDDFMVANFIPCYRKSDNEAGMYDTVSGTFYTNNGTGTFLVGNPVEYSTISLLEARRRILLNTPHLESLSGATASFETDMGAKLKECKIHFTPIQEGSGDPSPDNVRPIVGWDGVTVTRCGKNLFGGSAIINAIADTNSSAVVDGDTVTYKAVSGLDAPIFSNFKANTRYTFIITGYKSQSNVYINLAVLYTDGTHSFITLPSGFAANTQYTIVLTSTANKTVKCLKNYSANYQNFTLIGSLSGVFEGVLTADGFEPYTATTLTIPFPQTIYGGYVDLVKGEVVEEWKEYVYPSKTNLFTDRGNGYYEVGFGDVNGKGYGSANNSMCSKLSYGFRTSTLKLGYELDYVLLGISNRFHTLVYSDTPMTAATARQWFIDNDIQLVRLVHTPTTYTLTPQAIKTLRGLNNIWSDANGNIEIKYWTH